MAWIHVIQGKQYQLSEGQQLDVIAQFAESLDVEAKEVGLKATYFTDDDDGLSIIVGKDLHKSAHIYAGQCVNIAPPGVLELTDEQQSFIDRIGNALDSNGIRRDKIEYGLFLAQFD